MSGPAIVITTVLTTLTIIVFAGVLAASVLPTGAIAHGSGFSGGHFGRHRGGHGRRGLSNHCERLTDDHTRMAGAMVGAYLELSDEQKDALDPLLGVVKRWRIDSAELCQQLASSTSHDVATGLATLESFLTRSAAAAAELQPAYSSFAASLTAEQQQTIKQMLERRHGRTES